MMFEMLFVRSFEISREISFLKISHIDCKFVYRKIVVDSNDDIDFVLLLLLCDNNVATKLISFVCKTKIQNICTMQKTLNFLTIKIKKSCLMILSFVKTK